MYAYKAFINARLGALAAAGAQGRDYTNNTASNSDDANDYMTD